MTTNKKMMNAIALAGALGFFALSAAPAGAWELCAKGTKSGEFMRGATSLQKKCFGKWVRLASARQLAMLDHMEMVDNDGDGVEETIRFTGVNVQVVSGSGATDGAINGLGNLVVGYDEDDKYAFIPVKKTGSHNLIVGLEHSYESYGGFVAGRNNYLLGVNSSVCGGNLNVASGRESSVSGGGINKASGSQSSVSGGGINDASGWESSVSGGSNNEATRDISSVSGGSNNAATGELSSVSGGNLNIASGINSSVSGGESNEASGSQSSVSGGINRTCTTTHGVCH